MQSVKPWGLEDVLGKPLWLQRVIIRRPHIVGQHQAADTVQKKIGTFKSNAKHAGCVTHLNLTSRG